MKDFRFAFVLAVLFFFSLTVAAQSWTSNMSIQINKLGSNTYNLSVDVSSDPRPPAEGYEFYWYTDDGDFTITSSNTLNGYHFKEVDPSHVPQSVYVEITKRYDDDDEPENVANGGTIATPPSTFDPADQMSGSTMIEITPNRDLVEGHLVTYIISYGNFCSDFRGMGETIRFTFPSAKLDYLGGSGSGLNKETVPGSVIGNVVEIGNLKSTADQSEANRVFLFFRVKPSVLINENIQVSANLEFPQGSSYDPDCIQSGSCEQLVKPSHDPNYIIGNREVICNGAESGEKMIYTIHFQNTGAGAASNVEVRNYLPLYFNPDEVYWLKPDPNNLGNPQYVKMTPDSDGLLVWNLNYDNNGQIVKKNSGLRGTGEPNYGSEFSLDATTDQIVYQVEFSDQRVHNLDPCQTIYNRAEIIFDCNPSIFTNFYSTNITCLEGETCYCLSELKDTLLVNSAEANIPLDLTLNLNGMNPKDVEAVWYPPIYNTGKKSSFLSPTLQVQPPGSVEYMVSLKHGECAKTDQLVSIEIPCELSITAEVNPNCRLQNGKLEYVNSDIVLTANNYSDANNLECGIVECTGVEKKESGKSFPLWKK